MSAVPVPRWQDLDAPVVEEVATAQARTHRLLKRIGIAFAWCALSVFLWALIALPGWLAQRLGGGL